MKNNSIPRDLVLLGIALRDLIEEHNNKFIYNEEGVVHDYVIDYVKTWLQKNHPDNSNHLKKEIEELIDKILNYIIEENLLLRDTDFLKQDDPSSRTYSPNEINTHENLDGGKYLGKSFRDNGSFGSIPLYDDYSEESDS